MGVFLSIYQSKWLHHKSIDKFTHAVAAKMGAYSLVKKNNVVPCILTQCGNNCLPFRISTYVLLKFELNCKFVTTAALPKSVSVDWSE